MVRIKALNLRACTDREAGVHGFYSGFTEAAFTALLAQASAATFFYAILIHGSSLLTLVAQYLGAWRAVNTTDRRIDLAFFCFMQALILYLLFFFYLFYPDSGQGLAVAVCLVSLLSIFFGTFSSPSWHAAWASNFSGSDRRDILNYRTLKMTAASFVAVILGACLINYLGVRLTLIILIGLAATAKLFSSCTLWNAQQFEKKHKASHAVKKVSLVKMPRVNYFIATLSFGLGLSIAFLIPYLNHFLGFTSDQIFILGLTQIFGQLLLTSFFCRVRSRYCAKTILKVSVIMLSILPLSYCFFSSFRMWQVIFLVSGIASGAMGLGVQYLIQTPLKANDVVNKLTNISVSVTVSQIIGGIIGALLIGLGIFQGAENYYFIFILAALVRFSSIFIPIESSREAKVIDFPSINFSKNNLESIEFYPSASQQRAG